MKNVKFYICLILIWCPWILKGQYRYGANLSDSIFKLTLSRSNTLYAGIDNPVEIDIDDNERFEDYILETTNGVVVYDSLRFITIPVRSGLSRLVLSKIEANDTILKGHRFYRVKNVPDPLLRIDTICYDETSDIYKRQLLQSDSISIFFSPDIIDSENWFKITGYSIGYIFGGFYRSYSFEGDQISSAAKSVVMRISPGKIIVFRITAESEGNIKKEMPVYRLRLF